MRSSYSLGPESTKIKLSRPIIDADGNEVSEIEAKPENGPFYNTRITVIAIPLYLALQKKFL